MGNTFADITEDGNVWDEERLKLSEDTFDDWIEPTILIAPVAFENRGPEGQPSPNWQAAKAGASRKRKVKVEPEEQVWTIELDRVEGQKLGVGMRCAPNGRLHVTSIDDGGILKSWNASMPSRAVRAGDRILSVNGDSTKEAIFRSFGSASSLSIVLGRDEDLSEFDAGVQKPNQVVLQPGSGQTAVGRELPSASRSSTVQGRRWVPLEERPDLHSRVLLTPQRLSELHPFLPLSVRFASNWKLIYCPRIHGTSLRTFYRQCQAWPSETLFFIEDSEGAIFGGFASCPWKVSREKLHFGAPNCFVFSYGVVKESSLLQVYPWAGSNDFFMYADGDGFSMGGGARYAVWVDKEFLRGTSAPSSTFGNEAPLASGEDFVIRHFECWAFDSEHFGSSLSQALVREHRCGLREGNDALSAAFSEVGYDPESIARQEFIADERRRGSRDLDLRDYAAQALRIEAIS